ncbi:MAG: aspartate-semialdehyde dehydrogenase [Thermoprotei archaeon]
MTYDVAVLGATGIVGQRYVSFLSKHPWFNLVQVAASDKKVGMKYGSAVSWFIEDLMPSDIIDLKISRAVPHDFKDIDIVFSALPTDVAKYVEMQFVKNGFSVFSDTSPYRMEPIVPLVIPEVNHAHLELLKVLPSKLGGILVKSPNCTSNVLSLSLKPLIDVVQELKLVNVTSLQAISGAGYTGLYSMSIHDNIIPYIKGEEEKLSIEPRKILGNINGNEVVPRNLWIEATTTRVPVIDGHTVVVHALVEKNVDFDLVLKSYKEFSGIPQRLNLPTAPKKPIILREEYDRPQPRLDRNSERGMAVSIGRFRLHKVDKVSVIKYVATGHNTIRGASGNTILNAELAAALGFLKR